MKNLILYCFLTLLNAVPFFATAQPTSRTHFSTAGFYELAGTGRTVSNMNPAWRFHKGSAKGAESASFDDRTWDWVSLPHGIELQASEASGCTNYQGEVWYRKKFMPQQDWKGKKQFLYFEGIMGKSKVWLNGNLITTHYGGFLPVIADLTPFLQYGKENVIAVWSDNSDDPSYPPGKSQDMLDFTYSGGIYRDCWMIVHNPVYLTDANFEKETAGGGVFISYSHVSEKRADVQLKIHLRNASQQKFSGKTVYELYDAEGSLIKSVQQKVSIPNGKALSLQHKMIVDHPLLWSPDSPHLYHLHIYIKDKKGNTIDGYEQRIGIRSIEFKGKEGFWLNGKPYPEPLIGANRHQDFAVIGNALPNSLHWRDAKKLRDAGLRVIRNAHYPQDPAFMDACDELGLFVIVNTPGWQFWNPAPSFAQYIYSDIRNMVRRDRNHASVWLWEPILNETYYPADFAKKVKEIVEEEYPYPYCYSGCDASARGHEFYDVQFAHPSLELCQKNPNITYFTREWGDNVDDWNSHNSPSRVARNWGEVPMLIQAKGYAKPDYPYTCYDAFYHMPAQHVGGCLWHSFDHQRGYHPDPFYGGIMDNFRQPKTAYHMFCAQRPAQRNEQIPAETGPMVHIAHIMSPFSPESVTVYSNCEEVRLTCGENGRVMTYKKDLATEGMPSPIITFDHAFNVMNDKALARQGKHAESYLLAEGLVNGKVVASHKVYPARRPSKIKLWVDDEGLDMRADGSDMAVVVAAVTDNQGNIKRLNNYSIRFEVEGEGKIVGNAATQTNPRAVQWGTAPVIIQSTTNPGKIKVKASVLIDGKHMPESAEIEIKTLPSSQPLIATHLEKVLSPKSKNIQAQVHTVADKAAAQKKLKEVEEQQSAFE